MRGAGGHADSPAEKTGLKNIVEYSRKNQVVMKDGNVHPSRMTKVAALS